MKNRRYDGYLASFVDKYEFYRVVGALGDGSDLCGNPCLIFVFKPDSRSLAVNVFSHCQGLAGVVVNVDRAPGQQDKNS